MHEKSPAEILNGLGSQAFRVETLANSTLTLESSFDFTMYRQFRIVFTGVQYVDLPMGLRTNGVEWADEEPDPAFLAEFGTGGSRGICVSLEGFVFRIYFHGFEITRIQ